MHFRFYVPCTPTPTTTSESYDANQYKELAALDFKSGDSAVFTVNNGRSTLDISQWEENKVIYGDLDPLNRTTFVTAYLDRKNLGRSEGRERQVWKPTGWHQKKVDGELIVNRGHLLAYTSSFNFDSDGNFREGESGSQDNPKNLATQTAFSNQNVQTIYEKKVRDAQKTTGNKVIYQIVTVFRGNELMPRGYWLQAIDSNGILNFNVYVYNVQPKVVFNYEDGTSTIDRSLTIR
ncbi:DNA/RNA non-specific endonuclease [Enterococcus faecalis]|uniref:DNA/RNA non-specific endonuclease n=1 Tax=Enterococcus faecalis TaxID=1351 RepID=UPI001F0067B2